MKKVTQDTFTTWQEELSMDLMDVIRQQPEEAALEARTEKLRRERIAVFTKRKVLGIEPGTCIVCRQPIEPDRLAALPDTDKCCRCAGCKKKG